jgi:hypothetical protein
MVEEHRTAVYEERTMSEQQPPYPPQAYPPQYGPSRPMPQSTLQMAHVTSDAVISGLGRSPMLLGVVVLNCIGIAAAVYFLNLLISGQQAHLKSLLEVQNRQQTEIVTLHKAEFDALLEMAQRYSIPIPTSPIAPGQPGLNPLPPVAPPVRGR